MVTLIKFEDAPPTVCTEGAYSGNLLDEPITVRRVPADYDLLRAAALSPEASLSTAAAAQRSSTTSRRRPRP
ncbi:Scr1 family TA system antitoxin-like transcriptional regulator [Streptomyces chattanoogensis]|uniref:Scr1 family TA system antitoxin-like transcriptional regulator n=1 Tax=Streptomyces chattanoogensis TaxID=66876 RepID=UPI003675A67D